MVLTKKRAALSGVVLGTLALVGVLTFTTLTQDDSLMQQDVDDAIQNALASVTPEPSIIAQAYGVIARSVVSVQVLDVPGTNRGEVGVGAGVVMLSPRNTSTTKRVTLWRPFGDSG